jgi:hypothetical protein
VQPIPGRPILALAYRERVPAGVANARVKGHIPVTLQYRLPQPSKNRYAAVVMSAQPLPGLSANEKALRRLGRGALELACHLVMVCLILFAIKIIEKLDGYSMG